MSYTEVSEILYLAGAGAGKDSASATEAGSEFQSGSIHSSTEAVHAGGR